ncbi:hypothetical protein ABTX80_33365 [Streptomyces erythrochromogenes]|uniref:hypothetical protein n=1 Tax=Streptomyces erythrochromogenes TaxID=285574 RepID=UPI00332C4C1F
MGVLFGYYAARDDDDAGRAVRRDDGGPAGTGYDQFVVKGADPVVQLLPAEVLLTGRSAEAVEADPRHGGLIATVRDGEVVSVSLTEALRDSLADCGPRQLGSVARAWSGSDVFAGSPTAEGLAEFLESLAALARRAVAHDRRLYCWICP